MQWLAEVSIKRPVFASVLILALVVVGVFSYFELGVDRFPKVDFPTVSVTIRQPGAAPEDVETEITDRVERAINTVSGIDEMRSVSTEGVAQVFVQFQLEKNVDVAAQEVRDKISQVLADLPRDIDPPIVDKIDSDAAPILFLSLAADLPIREITEFADKTVRRELESLPGVGQVLVVGGQPRQINLWLDPARLRAYNLTVAEVTRAVANQNLQLPGGNLGQGPRELTVRMKGRVNSVPEFNGLVVASRDGAQIRLQDLATVEDGTEEVETAASIDGKPAVLLTIRKQSGTNTVAVINGVKARLRELQPRLPAGYRLQIVRDQSEYIEASVKTVQEHLVVGALPGLAGGAPLPPQLALHRDRGHRHPGLDREHLRAHVGDGLHAQHHHPARADPRRRHRHRRRDRRPREHLPVHGGEGPLPAPGGDRGHPRDRAGGPRHHALAGRRVPPGGLHGRHRGPVHELLRADHGVRDPGLPLRRLHADPDDGQPLARLRQARRALLQAVVALLAPGSGVHAGRSPGRWPIAG